MPSCEFIRNCQLTGWFKEPTTDNLHASDYNKHYTSNLMGEGLKFGWAVYHVFAEIKPFDGIIEAEYCYIETDNFSLLHGNGAYDAKLIECALNEKNHKKSTN